LSVLLSRRLITAKPFIIEILKKAKNSKAALILDGPGNKEDSVSSSSVYVNKTIL